MNTPKQQPKSRLTIFEKKKAALEIAIKAGGKPILNSTLLTNAKTIYQWLKR